MSSGEKKQVGLKWYQRIGNRIVLVAVLSAALPLFIISSTIAVKLRNDLIQQTVLAQKQRAQTIKHGIESLLAEYYQQIETLARLPMIQGMNPVDQNFLIREFLEQQKIFFSCAVYNRHKSIKSVALRNRKDAVEFAPEDFSTAPDGSESPLTIAFEKVIRQGKPVFSSFFSQAFHEKMLFVFVPVFDFVDPESVIGVISCSISLSDPGIHEIICEYPIDKEDILILTDKNGLVISWQGNLPENFAGLRIPADYHANKRAHAARVDLGMVEYLGTIAHVPVFDGFLLAAKPWNLAMAFLNQLLLDLALVFAIALVIAVAAGYYMASTLAGGIDSLILGIRQVADGVVSHRVEISGEDELAEAGNAFNEMVGALEKHRMIDEIWSREWGATQEKNNDVSHSD